MAAFSPKASLPDIPEQHAGSCTLSLDSTSPEVYHILWLQDVIHSSQVTPGIRPEKRYGPGTTELTLTEPVACACKAY